VTDAAAPEPREADDARGGSDEVDGDRLAVAGQRQRRGLAGVRDEPGEQGTRELPHVKAGKHPVGERDEVQTEAVGTAGLTLDEPAAFQRGEQPRCGARVDAGSAGELVDAEAGIARRECVEQRERAPDRSDWTRDASRSRVLRSQRPVLAARRWRRRRPSCEELAVATRSGLADSSDRMTWTWIPAGANRSRE
jgi:hypothetical protein